MRSLGGSTPHWRTVQCQRAPIFSRNITTPIKKQSNVGLQPISENNQHNNYCGRDQKCNPIWVESKNATAIGNNNKHNPRSKNATPLRRKTQLQCTEVTNCASSNFRWPTVMGMTPRIVPIGLFPSKLFNLSYVRCAMGYKEPSRTLPACNTTRELTLGEIAICSSQEMFQSSPVAIVRTQA